jgi:protein-S-isoprenylcysteine O-methyltransferase Ste14
MNTKRFALLGVILLYFVICLEILIMISPFAGFFYAAFNPVLLQLADHGASRWLTAFFLPHMAVPTTGFLIGMRVLGSWIFLGGMAIFIVCALQIYAAKFRRKGAVAGGLYRFVRHPQYLGLALAGAGLAILWPRFLVVVLWCLMVLLYYYLARDEEKRMLKAHGETYGPYLDKTGMFLPRSLERWLMPQRGFGRLLLWLLVCTVALGGAYSLRAYTINHLVLRQQGNVTALALLPEDGIKLDHRLADLLALPEIASRLQPGTSYLAYFLPRNYIMQGMIADTGGDWQLYKQHHTMSMISDWILHPFRHLRQGHHSMAHGQHGTSPPPAGISLVRRLIFLRLEPAPVSSDPAASLDIDRTRTPVFTADVDVHEARLLEVSDLPESTGWGHVPTPTF